MGSFEVKQGGALALSYVDLGNHVTVEVGTRAVSLTDCALNFVSESAFDGAGNATGTSNTCAEVRPSENNDPNIVYDSLDAWRRTVATVSCDGGRGAGTVVADPAIARACRTDGSWSMANPSCEPCCSGTCSCGCSDGCSICDGSGCCTCDGDGSGCCSSGCGGYHGVDPNTCCDLACISSTTRITSGRG